MKGLPKAAKSATLKVKVSKTLQNKIRKGFPWVFRHQVQNKIVSGKPGDLGVVYDADNRFLAIGIYDPFSEISLRILQTTIAVEINTGFFKERFTKALTLRIPLKNKLTTGYRLLNGENDGFPGLILDRYADTAVMKIYSCAWVPYLEIIHTLAKELLPIKRCVLRLSRKVDDPALPSDGHILSGEPLKSPVRFQENGIWFEADVINGQKTGFYFDQRENRFYVKEMVRGKSVLNVFSYTGGFSVYAFAGKCSSVLEIEVNRHALRTARTNLALNFPGKTREEKSFQQIQGDALQELARLNQQKKTFDLVILDPPPFARNKKQRPDALKAYAYLAEAGSRQVKPGGILFAASCSAPVGDHDFYHAIDQGIKAAGRCHKELLKTGHALDHPITFKEGSYLKGTFRQLSN
ncbi:MAG: class I SAM-dependent rRNA methyltransferase [Nitrospinota bacterium]|nr:class I SAM-dependent rRNA methyltransferase [Nitrospinota bacterium]